MNEISPSPGNPPPVTAPSRPWLSWLPLLLLLICALVVVSFFLSGVSRFPPERGVEVIRIQGTIVTGEYSGGEYTGSEEIGRRLRRAADDPMVDAIVLRINSGGGTPAGAQEIIRDILYTREKKVIVASLGDIATSGAYYVAAYTNRIYANPDTVTGGIGTIWTFWDYSGWMEEEGISVEQVKSAEMKDMGSGLRNMSEGERMIAQSIVNASAENLISDILSQRPADRSAISGAQVYRGEDALEAGLVDEIGNLNDAIEGARKLRD